MRQKRCWLQPPEGSGRPCSLRWSPGCPRSWSSKFPRNWACLSWPACAGCSLVMTCCCKSHQSEALVLLSVPVCLKIDVWAASTCSLKRTSNISTALWNWRCLVINFETACDTVDLLVQHCVPSLVSSIDSAPGESLENPRQGPKEYVNILVFKINVGQVPSHSTGSASYPACALGPERAAAYLSTIGKLV